MSVTDQPWTRVVTPGRTPDGDLLFVTIQWQHERNQMWELSLCGVEGPKANGNCAGGAGQCGIDEDFAPGDYWDDQMVGRLRDIWDRWHLNGMRPGSPNQEDWKRANPYDRDRHGHDHYAWVTGALTQAGLNPDPNFARADGKPYRYGSAWLYEEVPADVLEWLYHLPPAVTDHQWGDRDCFIEEATDA